MLTSPSISKTLDTPNTPTLKKKHPMLILHRLAATIMYFTKLPLWKYIEVDKTHFKHVVTLWSLDGWLTSGLMMLVYWGASFVFPTPICILLA